MMVSATAPLVQGWFALTGHRRSTDPYFLYAASNAGSLLALLSLSIRDRAESRPDHTKSCLEGRFSHPGDPGAGLRPDMRAAWSRSRPARQQGCRMSEPPMVEASPTLGTWSRWIVLVFIPSSWLMGVTAYLTTDLAAMPLMWIIPLSLYLLELHSGLLELHGGAGPRRHAVTSLSHRAAGAGHVCRLRSRWFGFPFIWRRFSSVPSPATACLARMRPPPRYLSLFYITIALGGLLGGIWNALVAPLVFNRVVEYPLALVLACLVAPGSGHILRRHASKQLVCAICSSRASCSC